MTEDRKKGNMKDQRIRQWCENEGRMTEITDVTTPLNDLSEAQLAKAHKRFDIIQPFLEGSVSLTRIVEGSGKSLRTLRYWVARYKKDGLSGLATPIRPDVGKHRVREELRALIVALALKSPKLSATLIHEDVQETAQHKGWHVPSYRQVLGIVRTIDPQLSKLAHEGTQAHKDAYDLLVRYEASGSNERWQIDHKFLKIWVEDDGEPRKVCLTAVEDDYSRAITGYYLHVEPPSALCGALALRQAILPKPEAGWPVCGIPKVIYNDNGPDFTSEHLEQVAAHLGARTIFSIPYQPRGRGKIERFFRTLEQRFVPKAPGYLSRGKPVSTKGLLTIEQLDARFRTWLLDRYQTRVHAEIKQTPLERWSADGFFPNLPGSTGELDLLLLTIANTRTVQRDGISFKSGKYSDLALGAYIGEPVTIRYDPRDSGEIRVYHEGKFVCRAVSRERAVESLSFKEISKANSRRRKSMQDQIRDTAKEAKTLLEDDEAVARHNQVSEKDQKPKKSAKSAKSGGQPPTGLKLRRHEW